uniref:L-2-amino-thiazoline-4-carboxylic acid hydrolase n=1 Tax=Roseihalotalea indica TaxID=2867963 RepID=A0AA49GRH4_9BACT|nr:L-2-amino-thiazoline-4-carboxylic acid hydrolase [Tunicatimonas sp. TK19036]
MRTIIVNWFRIQTDNAAKIILAPHFNSNEVHDILRGYWRRYLKLKPEVPAMPTLGGAIMVHLAVMSTGFFQELIAKGKSEEIVTEIFYDIAWKVYRIMGRFSWCLAGWSSQNSYSRLEKATKLFRAFPFNSPSYQWNDVQAGDHVVRFDCLKCPVASYFQTKGLSTFCVNTWCALDYPLAEMWDAKLQRSGSIAGGATKCDFRWVAQPKVDNV